MDPVINIDPEIMGGTPVFSGTRVPVKALFDYLEGNQTLDDFFEDFPTVKHSQAIKALQMAQQVLLTTHEKIAA